MQIEQKMQPPQGDQQSHPKRLVRVAGSARHTVGDGFEIRRPLPGPEVEDINPFLVLDHSGPTVVEPSDRARGVDEHPHRGFETVTVLYQGEIEHRDSAGNSGRLKAGDVQWMTAASGIVHEEKHGKDFTRQGGTLELVQLWVNLPGRHKSEKPGYQDIRSEDIPVLPLEQGGFVRVIAGMFRDTRGAARTFTPVTLLDIKLEQGTEVTLPVAEGHTAGLYVLRGQVEVVGEGRNIREGELGTFTTDGGRIDLRGTERSRMLLLGGEPINEPVVSYGPFVMNSVEEIQQAFADYRAGKMGTLDLRIKKPA